MPRRRISSETRLRPKRGWLLLAGGGFLILLAVLLARPVQRYFRQAEAESQVALARAALEHQAWEEALRHAGAALQMQPSHGAALHVAADAFNRLGGHPDEVVDLLSKAEEAGQTQPEIDLMLAQAHLRRGDLPAAQTALSDVPPEARGSWLATEVEATLLLAQGREPAMAALLRERLEAAPAAPGAAFRLAVLDLNDPAPARRAAAKDRLMQEARAGSEHTPKAVHLLLQLPDLQATEALELAEAARQLPEPSRTELRYAALGAVLRLEVPAQRTVLLSAEEANVAKLGPEAAFRYVLFLATNREHERMLAFIETHRKDLARSNLAQLLQLELEALSQTRQWSLVAEKLKSPAASRLEPWSRHLWHACTGAAEASPNLQHVTLSLQAAFQATERGRHTSHALYIADTAVLLGQHDFAITCYEVLLESAKLPAQRITLLEKVCAIDTPETATRLRFARQLADLTPGHYANAFRSFYLELLTPAPLDEIGGIALRLDQMAVSNPGETQAAQQHLLWAMIMYRREQKSGLEKELSGLEHAVPWPPGQRAVIAGLLAYASQTARAFQVAEKVPAVLLLPEERQMLELAQ